MGVFLSRVLEWKAGASGLSGLHIRFGVDKRRGPELAPGFAGPSV